MATILTTGLRKKKREEEGKAKMVRCFCLNIHSAAGTHSQGKYKKSGEGQEQGFHARVEKDIYTGNISSPKVIRTQKKIDGRLGNLVGANEPGKCQIAVFRNVEGDPY